MGPLCPYISRESEFFSASPAHRGILDTHQLSGVGGNFGHPPTQRRILPILEPGPVLRAFLTGESWTPTNSAAWGILDTHQLSGAGGILDTHQLSGAGGTLDTHQLSGGSVR